MGDQRSQDVEGQMESIPLYPQLVDAQQQQQQQQMNQQQLGTDELDGNLTQADLDRVWKPVFEDYTHAGSVIVSGCCAPSLAMPVQHLRKLLSLVSKDDGDGVDGWQQQISRPTKRRVLLLQSASAPRLSRRVIDLICNNADTDGDGWISYQEFCDVILIRHKNELEMDHLDMSHRILNNAVQSVTPKSYDEYYTCCPPPLFIILVSLVEIGFYVYYSVTMKEFSLTGPTPIHSPLIYDPHRRHEAWRFLTYTFLHKGFIHIANNLVLQLVVGIPLEMVHGWWRIALCYLLGSTMGSLGHSLLDANTYLLGASGGVYALLGAHGANVLINWKEMRFGILRAALLGLYIIFDVSWAIYQRLSNQSTQVGYMAHAGGFFGGLFLGVLLLKNFRVYKFERVLFWMSLVFFILLVIVGIVINATSVNCGIGCQSDFTSLIDYSARLKKMYERP